MSFNHQVPLLLKLPYNLRYCHFVFLLLVSSSILALDRNIGISFIHYPESRTAPPGDRVFFTCKTNIGKGEQLKWYHDNAWLDPSVRQDVQIKDNQLAIKVHLLYTLSYNNAECPCHFSRPIMF